MHRIALLTAIMTLSGCSYLTSPPTHPEALANAQANIKAAAAAIAPFVDANCAIAKSVEVVVDPILVLPTTTACALVNSANAVLESVPAPSK